MNDWADKIAQKIGMKCYSVTEFETDIAQALRDERKAERERCAVIAHAGISDTNGRDISRGYTAASEFIEQLIRGQ